MTHLRLNYCDKFKLYYALYGTSIAYDYSCPLRACYMALNFEIKSIENIKFILEEYGLKPIKSTNKG